MCTMCAIERLNIIDLKVTITLINNLCNIKNVKFHCFNPQIEQPLETSLRPTHSVWNALALFRMSTKCLFANIFLLSEKKL